MNKDEFVREIASRTGYPIGGCGEILDSIISIFNDCVEQKVEIDIRGFGHLRYKTTPAHEGNKPVRGKKGVTERIQIPETTSAKFVLATNIRKLAKIQEE